MVKIGIIGGSGLEQAEFFKNKQAKNVSTPYGTPASQLICGSVNDVPVVMIARHGLKHEFRPTDVPYRANIWALKQEGCTHIIATTACGSLRENIKPGDLVILDQFIDRTTKREQSFYDTPGKVCHIPMGNPFCPKLCEKLVQSAKQLSLSFHARGTIVTIEGPRFSTKAESALYQNWNADVINMSTVPEAVLAREAGMCYASIALSTDYDCWKENTEHVTLEMVLKTMKENAEKAKTLILATLEEIKDEPCSCREAIKTAVL